MLAGVCPRALRVGAWWRTTHSAKAGGRALDCLRQHANYCVMRAALTDPRGGCLRVPPSLAATGSQEIKPVSGALASKGDA